MELSKLQKHQLLSVFAIGLVDSYKDSFLHFITEEQAELIAEKTKLVRLGLTEQMCSVSLKQLFDMLYNDVIGNGDSLIKQKEVNSYE